MAWQPYEDLYRYQRDLLDGHPPWIATQNRVLGPYLIDLLMRFSGGDYPFAYNYFMHISFFLVALSTLVLCKAHRLQNADVCVTIAAVCGIVLLLFNHWWFPWSNLEFALLCFAFACFEIRSPATRVVCVGALFVLMCLNKETAVFFPLWLLVDCLARYYFDRTDRLVDVSKKVLAYSLMIFASLIVTSILRRELWVSGNIPGLESGVLPSAPTFLGNVVEILGPGLRERSLETFKGFYAMLTFKSPVPLFGNGHWGDWSQVQLLFWVVFGSTVIVSTREFSNKDTEKFSLVVTCLFYALMVAVLSNPAELDKIMGVLAFGLFYWLKRVRGQQANPDACICKERSSLLKTGARRHWP